MKIKQASSSTIVDLWSIMEPCVLDATFLEEAAHAFAANLHMHFKESVVLARVFVTVPFAELPETNQQFVRGLVTSSGAAADLKSTTPVLSLIGSFGQEEDWRDRRRSQGHVGIPMVSSSFVRTIPMISRLLKELGVPVDWVDSHDSEMIVNTIGNTVGLFFVENAETATDGRGRKIIGSQDFVSDYSVKSVFGTGGAYPCGQIVVAVVFCRDRCPRTVAEQFPALTSFFIGNTTRQIAQGMIFSN